MTFAKLGLIEPLLRALEHLKYTTPTPVQAAAIPAVLAGRDLKLAGANAGAQQDLLLFGGRDVDIAAARNTQDDYDYRMVKKSGFGALGGLSIGTRRQTDAIDSKTALSAASTVGRRAIIPRSPGSLNRAKRSRRRSPANSRRKRASPSIRSAMS